MGGSLLTLMLTGSDATARTTNDRSSAPLEGDTIDVTAAPFSAAGDGRGDDAPAIQAAVDALPASGGAIYLPGPRIYRLGHTIRDGAKPVSFKIGHAQVIGPDNGPLFELHNNGSSIAGAGPGATILRMSAPARAPTLPVLNALLNGGKVRGVRLVSPGADLASTPLIEVSDSPTHDGAAVIATVGQGKVIDVRSVAAGASYTQPPVLQIVGGGECAILLHQASHCRLSDFTLDMAHIPHAVGVFQYGGWYVQLERINIDKARQHATAIGLVIDSHTLGEAGRNGNWGGAYVNHYTQVVTRRCFVVGHDSSTATTIHFDTLDAANLHLHAAVGILLSNVVLQGSEGAFLDLVNVDALSMIGGDVEGPATFLRTRGTCNNLRLSPLAYAANGPFVQGPVGAGWRIDLAAVNSQAETLHTGNGGSAGIAYQNMGWREKHRVGIQFAGSSMVFSSNLRMTGPYEGILDNPQNPGFALLLTISGQLVLRYAPPGNGKVKLSDMAMFDQGGVQLRNLPNSPPPQGASRLWYDPAVRNWVKFMP